MGGGGGGGKVELSRSETEIKILFRNVLFTGLCEQGEAIG